jgi:hypothetical protein
MIGNRRGAEGREGTGEEQQKKRTGAEHSGGKRGNRRRAEGREGTGEEQKEVVNR